LFQSAWFITILAAANGLPYVGPLFTLIWIGFHLLLISGHRKSECILFISAAFTGYTLEFMLVMSKMIVYPSQTMLGILVPIWMITLWINLAATLHYSLSWLKNRYLASAVLAAVAAPLAYGAGARLGAIQLSGTPALILIALAWSLAMPFLFWLTTVFGDSEYTKDQMLVTNAD